jgi:NAD(P)-dependent dehydrogenase (short-subunit alcohol dehydrogenase family)
VSGSLNGRGGMALAITTDVTHGEQVKRLVDAAVQTYGRSIDLGPP